MITISGVLVVVAIGMLVPGFLLDILWLVYASVGACLASAVCLVVGVFIGRSRGPARGRPAKGSTKTGASGKSPARGERRPAEKSAGKQGAGAAKSKAAKAESAKTKSVAVDDAPAEVVVVPGRLRYHLDSCRQVTGRETEELSVADARGQGYAACTSCRPDSVLAARAEASDAAATDDDDDDDNEADPDAAEDDAGADTETPGAADTAADDTEPDDAEADDTEPAVAGSAALVVAVVGQRRYHLEGCQVIVDAREDDAETRELDVAEARDDGLTACTVCRPST